MQKKTIAGLETVIGGGDPSQGAIVLLHGYGASNQDLAPLAQPFSQIGPWQALFPGGQIDVPIGPHMTGSAWFAIDMMRLQMIMMSGRDNPYDDITPPGLTEAAVQIKKFLEELAIPFDRIVLGGFSQGSMVALETALTSPTPFAGVALLSCTKTSGTRWTDLIAEKGPSLNIFQSHGQQDPVLPIGAARRLADDLRPHAANFEYEEFDGGHEIPGSVLQGLARFLPKALSTD